MPIFFRDVAGPNTKSMVFVDGENFAIRFGKKLDPQSPKLVSHVHFEPNIFVWSSKLKNICQRGGVIRTYYYTSVKGSQDKIDEIQANLKSIGIEAPRVFKKNKTRGSKRVDISLATDMLMHASRKNIDIAVLIAGDEDYVPLVEAVKLEGCRLFLWFFEEGLSPSLRIAADRFVNLDEIFFRYDVPPQWW